MTTTLVKLNSVELDTDFHYLDTSLTFDTFHDEAQAQLNLFVGATLDVSEFLSEGDEDDDVAVSSALEDKLTDLTDGLLTAWVEFERV